MQLLIIQDYLRGGGTEKQSVYVANMLHEHGCSVGCMTFRPGGVQRASLKLPEHRVTTLQPFDSHLNVWSPGLVKRIRELNPEVVLLMGYAANEKGEQIKRALPEVSMVASMRTGRSLSSAYRRTLAVADRVIVNSQWALDLLVAEGWADRERILLINNPFTRDWDLTKLEEWRATERKRMGIADDECLFLNVAGFRQNKGQDELIELFSSLSIRSKWKLVFVGDGPKLNHCRRRVRQLQMEDRVNFLGYQADPGGIMAAADIMVTASRRDAQPNALIEAQFVGLPIVAFDFAGIGECFEDGKSGFLLPLGDADSFLSKVRLLVEDRELRGAHSHFAKSWAREKFSVANLKQNYIGLFSVHC